VAYLHACLPHLDAITLQEAKDILSRPDETQGTILRAVERQLVQARSLHSAKFDAPITDVDWRLRVKTSLGEILVPDDISWMEDDDTMTDQEYTKRILDDLCDRFERYVLWF